MKATMIINRIRLMLLCGWLMGTASLSAQTPQSPQRGANNSIDKVDSIDNSGNIEKDSGLLDNGDKQAPADKNLTTDAQKKEPPAKELTLEQRQSIVDRSLRDLSHSSSLQRFVASNYLLKHYEGGRDAEIAAALNNLLHSNPDIPVCFNLVSVLGKVKSKDPEATDVLVRIMRKSELNRNLRFSAIRALAESDDQKLVSELEQSMVYAMLRHDQELLELLVQAASKLRGKQYSRNEVALLQQQYKEQWQKDLSRK